MHGHFRHILAVTNQLSGRGLVGQGHDLTDDWSLPSAYFVDS